jgi:NAD(P)-dependent dehydrogenase (short-subunit alcohol dehydrogenase family)
MHDKPVVIVTGASRGVGAFVARWLGKAGAGVALMARSSEALDDVAGDVTRLGGAPMVFAADVSNPEACRLTVEKTLDQFGRIDALVNNAGIVQPIASIAQADPDSWRKNIEVNVIGPFYLARAAVRELRRHRGRIVNVTSGAANLALEHVSAYCTAKAALNHFTRILAAEEKEITSLAVRPGVVDTDMQAVFRREGAGTLSTEQLAYYLDLKASGELEPPSVPGRAIAWLALFAPREFNGGFLDYDDPRIAEPALAFFGKGLE